MPEPSPQTSSSGSATKPNLRHEGSRGCRNPPAGEVGGLGSLFAVGTAEKAPNRHQFTVIEEAGMTEDRISELEQRIAKLEGQVGELEVVVTQAEDVKAVGLGRGAEQAISILATYVNEVAGDFDMDEFLRRLRTVRGPRPVRLRVRRGKELFLKRLALRIQEVWR